jgi:hypothetical protein
MKAWLAPCALALLLWACDLSETSRPILLSLKLDDSLSAYDSIRVDILYSDGTPYREAAFHGKYVPQPGHALRDLDLGRNPPERYQVLVTAYRDATRALVYGVKVGPQGAEAPKVLVRLPPSGAGGGTPGETPPLRVVFLTPSPLALAPGGQAVQAMAEVRPDGADRGLAWSSSDTGVVRVDGGGMLFPGAPGEADITARSLRDSSLWSVLRVRVAESVRVKGMSLAPDHALLYVGGETLRLDARATPAEAQAELAYLSRDTSVVKVSSAGVISAVAPGSVDVLAYPKGDPSLALLCQVVVKRDVPRLEIGGDRTARPGDTVLFPVKATQEYGVVSALKWDLDADGIWDDSVAAETAMPRRAYDGRDSLVAAIFQVRDGEGNASQAFLFVHVGMGTRMLPPAFTTGTTPSPTSDPRPTWRWAGAAGGAGRFRISLDGGPERETRETGFTPDSLRDGAHSLTLRELDAFGSSSPTISRNIEVDRRGPAPIVTVLPGGAGPAWAWSPAPGSRGIGVFRYRLFADLPWSPETSDTAYAPIGLGKGTFTLEVQERDAEGNWSLAGILTQIIY